MVYINSPTQHEYFTISRESFVLALPIFPASSKYCAALNNMPVACCRRKNVSVNSNGNLR